MSNKLTKEDIEFLTMTANNLITQDNACTARPLLFQIATEEMLSACEDCNVDGYSYNVVGDDSYFDSEDEFIENLEEYHDINMKTYLKNSLNKEDAIEKACKENKIEYGRTPYQYVTKFQNAFLTRHGAEQHLKMNAHNLKRPHDRGNWDGIYVNHAYRNPELERIIEIILKFATIKEDKQ